MSFGLIRRRLPQLRVEYKPAFPRSQQVITPRLSQTELLTCLCKLCVKSTDLAPRNGVTGSVAERVGPRDRDCTLSSLHTDLYSGPLVAVHAVYKPGISLVPCAMSIKVLQKGLGYQPLVLKTTVAPSYHHEQTAITPQSRALSFGQSLDRKTDNNTGSLRLNPVIQQLLKNTFNKSNNG